ncbi:MAG TPA: hypothetical protein DCG38_07275 [Eubacteriaceae bacterium]|nr:hypothetical protein [Eubacteriaceae bacterium]
MKKRSTIKKYLINVIKIMIVMVILSSSVFASSVSVKSKSTYNPGDSVTISVTFSGNQIIGVQADFSYDKSILQYTGGQNVIYFDGSPVNSHTAKLTFKALKEGSSSVVINNIKVSTMEADETLSSKTVKVSVVKPATTSSSSSGSSSNTSSTNKTPAPAPEPEPEPEPEPDPMEKAVEVKIGEETKYLWPELLKVKLPEGFEKSKGVYGEDEIEVASSKDENTDIVLAYFTDKNGEKGAFYIFDEEKQEFYPRVNLNAKSSYTILRLNDAQEIPQGYVEAEFEIDGNKVEAWMLESGKSEDFVLLYAMNEEGEKGFYTYDKEEGTMQRFTDRVVEVEVLIEPEPMGVFEKIFGDPLLASIFGGLGLVAAGLTAGLVKLGKNSRM